MEGQQKIGKLYISKDIIDNSEARNTYYLNNTKSSRERTSINHQKYQKTEPSVENIKQELPKKHSRNKTQFSEEYMSIVHKLKVNLSKQLQKHNKVEIVKQRQYMFQTENRERNKTFIHGKDSSKQKKLYHLHNNQYSSLNKRASFDFQKEEGIKTLRFNKPSIHQSSNLKHTQAIKVKQSNLPLLTAQKERYKYKQPIQQVTEHNSPQKKAAKIVQKKQKGENKPSKQRKKEKSIIFRYFQTQSPKLINQNELYNQINPQFNKIDELCFHIQILIDILQRLNSQQQTQNTIQSTIKSLKQYVLGNKKVLPQHQKLILDDISHLDEIYISQPNQKLLRTMIFYQRVLIITCIDLLANSIFSKYKNDVDLILHSFLGIYIYFLSAYKETKELSEYTVQCLEYFQEKVTELNIHTKREIATTVFFISKKIFPILKSNLTLFRQIKILAQQFENRNVTINRSFYELLRLYAIYLNNNEDSIQKYHHTLRTFATCPSPYLTKPPQKSYTLVLDLDETLIHTHTEKHKFQIFMRPFLKQFLEVMARDCEIVIFTSSMPKYSQQIIKQLPFISHKLYRYHTTRLKSRHIKDLSRLGRPLQRIIMIDNEQQNFILQKSNGIKIQPWTGSNPKDQQLNILGLFLNQIISKKPEDVREYLPLFKEFRKKYQ